MSVDPVPGEHVPAAPVPPGPAPTGQVPTGQVPTGQVPTGPAPIGPVLSDAQLARLAGSRFAQVVQLAETTSTNSVLVGEAEGAAAEGMVLLADYQTAGRGRFDRRWESPPGKSLLFSVLLRPSREELPTARRHLAVAAVSLALVEAAREVAKIEVQLKWPNDLIVATGPDRAGTGGAGTAGEGTAGEGTAGEGAAGDRKVAGILAEATADGAIVVGAGVNVAWAPELFQASGAPATTCLEAVAGRPVPRGEVLVSALLALDRLYGDWDLVSDLYRQTCSTVGRRVTVSFAGHQPDLVGTAVAVNEDGRLVVRDLDGATVSVAAGDVTHARGARGPSLAD
jgi:BirA family transcriptional regulator, biotin operon repressor / biotin---[acetyl-CoA-carboxylase] ligase